MQSNSFYKRTFRPLALTVWGASLVLCGPLNFAYATPETARKSDDFVDSIGINVKLRYIDTPYGNYAAVKSKLQSLGVRHIRDGLEKPDANDQLLMESRLLDLAANGIKSTLIFSPGMTETGYSAEDSILRGLGRVQGAIEAVEGPNEPDANFSFNGKGFPQGAIDYQNVLWSTVKNSGYSALPVIAPSISSPPNSDQIQGMEYVSDYGNTHSYHGARNPETTEINLGLDNFYLPYANSETRGKPAWATETGNHTAPGNDSGIWMPSMASESGQASNAFGKYALRNYLFYFNKGIVRTFIHELVDEQGDSAGNPAEKHKGESNFGLYNNDWSPKTAAPAIAHTIALLKDPGANFTLGSLDYTLTGNTTNLHHLLLQKRDGTFELVLWQGVSSYDTGVRADILVPNASVTLTLNTPVGGARSYLPWSNGTTATDLTISNNTISLSVPDHPLIVELIPNSDKPDVIVTQTGTTGTLSPGSTIRFTATIKNQGTVATPANTLVGLGFYLQGAASPITWGSIPSVLGPGQSATITSDGTWTAQSGSYTFVAWVDDVNRFPESNEGNNILSQTVTISSNGSG